MKLQTQSTLLLLFIITFVSSSKLMGQCTNTVAYPSSSVSAPVNIGDVASISSCQYQTEYATISGIVNGNTYTATSDCAVYITIRSGTYNGTVVASGPSPFTFIANSNGTYYIHYNTNASCGTGSGCCTTTLIRVGAPCTNTLSNGSATAPTTGNTTTISTCQYQTQYATISSMVAGNNYQFTSSCGGYITIRSGTYNGTIVASGSAPLNFTPSTNGTYYVHYNTNSSCGTATTCCTTTIVNNGAPVGCTNTSSFGSATAPTTGNSATISTCQFQTEYATISSMVAGEQYQLTNSCGGYITVRSGSSSGTVVAVGNAPLSFTPAANGTYYVHYNTNSSCGTATNCCTTTIINGVLVPPTASPQDCEGAVLVCSNANFSGNASGSGLVNELNSTNQGCMSSEHQSSWYYLNIGTNGVLGMEITPASSDDYDWAIWGPFTAASAATNCPPITSPVRCSWSNTALSYVTGMRTGSGDTSEDASGDSWVDPLNVTAGQIYILLVDNFSASSDPFSLIWTGSAGLSCTPIVLGVDITSFTGEKEGAANVVSWTTSSEKNNDYFLLEHSTDGIKWNVLSKEFGAGNSSQIKNYNYIHRDFPKTTNYYRLIQVDFDGEKSYYSVIPIDNASDRKVIKVLNILGQEVDQHYKGMVIEYYDDNSYSKRIQ